MASITERSGRMSVIKTWLRKELLLKQSPWNLESLGSAGYNLDDFLVGRCALFLLFLILTMHLWVTNHALKLAIDLHMIARSVEHIHITTLHNMFWMIKNWWGSWPCRFFLASRCVQNIKAILAHGITNWGQNLIDLGEVQGQKSRSKRSTIGALCKVGKDLDWTIIMFF